jgi:hypothetical protein
MSSEIPRDQNTTAITGGASYPIERRSQKHSVQVAIFGGSRSTDKRKRSSVARKEGVGIKVVLFAALVLAMAAWFVYTGSVIKPGTGVGYYLGLVGGIMMLMMLLYPVRKHMRLARNWGPLRYWFMVHMIFGIGGPTLILFHTTFHVKSLNAAVALYSMLLVVASGVIGRFIYKRIHHGLYGRKSNLEELQLAVDASQNKISKVNALLMEATGIGEKLKRFREMAMEHKGAFLYRVWKFLAMGWRRRKLVSRCKKELQQAVDHLAKSQSWDKPQQSQYFRDVMLYVGDYLDAVKQAAQFSSYERLFRLWHILHSPFVWLLGVSGVVHVIATNFMY